MKQSGVQLGIVIAGVLLPWGAASVGWRPTVMAVAAIAGLLGLTALVTLPPEPAVTAAGASDPASRPSGETAWLVFFGLTTGMVGGAVLTYLPLFAQERVGFSVAAAGAAASVVGAFGMVGRIVAGHYSERLSHLGDAVAWLGIGSAVAVGLIWGGETWGPLSLWIGAALVGLSIMAWMPVLVLATMAASNLGDTGRASGVVVLGFLVGHAVGPPAFGFLVDFTERYGFSMGGLVILCLLTSAVAWRWARPREFADTSDAPFH